MGRREVTARLSLAISLTLSSTAITPSSITYHLSLTSGPPYHLRIRTNEEKGAGGEVEKGIGKDTIKEKEIDRRENLSETVR